MTELQSPWLIFMPNISEEYNKTTWTNEAVEETAPEIVITFMLLWCAWIILINALVIVCLILHRRAMKTFVNLQLLSFSITDMLVGITAIPESLTNYITPSIEICSTIIYGYIVAQTATLFHAFGICLHRYITVKYRRLHAKRKDKGQLKRIIIHVSVIWCLSVVLVAIPVVCYARFNHFIAECSLKTVFGENYFQFLAVINVLLLLPQVGMNCLYICLFRYLSAKWSFKTKTKTANQDAVLLSFNRFNATSEAHSSPAVNNIENQRFNETVAIDGNMTHGAEEITCMYKDRDETIVVSRIVHVENQQLNSENETALVEPADDRIDVLPEAISIQTKSEQYLRPDRDSRIILDTDNQSASSYSSWTNICRQITAPVGCKPLTFQKEKEVLCTIGILLILLNIFITPLNLFLLMELINDGYLSRKVKFSLMFMALINSGLNPFVYAFKMEPFRNVLKSHRDKCAAFLRKGDSK